MRTYTWDEYYEKSCDWAESTLERNMSYLTSFGSSDEVLEVGLNFSDEKVADRFFRKALDAGVRFTAEEVIETIWYVSESVLTRMAHTCKTKFTKNELEELYCNIDDAVFEKISKKSKIDIFKEEITQNIIEYPPIYYTRPPKQKHGFLTGLLLFADILDTINSFTSPKYPGRCTGDCKNCPPHYGYRFGRWFYGHGHMHGCELGVDVSGGDIEEHSNECFFLGLFINLQSLSETKCKRSVDFTF